MRCLTATDPHGDVDEDQRYPKSGEFTESF